LLRRVTVPPPTAAVAVTVGNGAAVRQSSKPSVGIVSTQGLRVKPVSAITTDGVPGFAPVSAASDAVHCMLPSPLATVTCPPLEERRVPGLTRTFPGSVRRNVVAEADEVMLRRPSASSVASRPSFRTGMVESF
jgi:hypothetical protein